MMKLNKGGMVLTGVGAYLVLTKGIRLLRGVVHDISETSKWKAYYRCKRNDPLAPGYNRVFDVDGRPIDGGSLNKTNASSSSVNGVLSDAIVKVINELFDDKNKKKEALEGQTEHNLDDQNYTKDLSDVEIDVSEKANNASDFLERIHEYREKGLTEEEIAKLLNNVEISELRKMISEAEFQRSINLARKNGVPEDQILHNQDECDRFFGFDRHAEETPTEMAKEEDIPTTIEEEGDDQ